MPQVDKELQTESPDTEQFVGKSRFVDNKAVVFALLFGVTGCLGIPLLWASRSFTRQEKLLWSVVVTTYTLALMSGVAGIVWWCYRVIIRTF